MCNWGLNEGVAGDSHFKRNLWGLEYPVPSQSVCCMRSSCFHVLVSDYVTTVIDLKCYSSANCSHLYPKNLSGCFWQNEILLDFIYIYIYILTF